ncbi:MAG: proliferating cell nuclear antigen (pcna) [Candidatus Diapherotrites archaeon]|nr:proliferating cell nuclear antigen (pcna) [Candidatus Diapherotrites archaeon]
MTNLELVLEEASDFKKSIDAISVLINEAEFIVDNNGLTLKATDPSQISMVDFLIKKESFKSYKLVEKTKIGLDLNHLAELVSRAKPKDELHLIVEEGNLKIILKGASKRTFSVPLIDISSMELPNPKISFDAELKIKADMFQDSLKDASLLSNHITLAIDDGTFVMYAESSKGSFRNELSKNDTALISLKSKGSLKATFPLDYLSNMMKGTSPNTEIMLWLKQDAPVKLQYDIGKANIIYYLAPRIEVE